MELELPEQWLWDIIDEFIYQYQVFCTWRSKVTTKTEEELTLLADGSPVRFPFETDVNCCRPLLDLEFVLCSECSLLVDAKIKNQRVHCCSKGRQISGGDFVCFYFSS